MTQALRSPVQTFHPIPVRPARTPLVAILWMVFLTLIVGGTVVGGLLGLLEMHAEDAVIARAAISFHPTAHEAAVFTWRTAPRG